MRIVGMHVRRQPLVAVEEFQEQREIIAVPVIHLSANELLPILVINWRDVARSTAH